MSSQSWIAFLPPSITPFVGHACASSLNTKTRLLRQLQTAKTVADFWNNCMQLQTHNTTADCCKPLQTCMILSVQLTGDWVISLKKCAMTKKKCQHKFSKNRQNLVPWIEEHWFIKIFFWKFSNNTIYIRIQCMVLLQSNGHGSN